MTVGEIRKAIANTTHEKVYSKSDALAAVRDFSTCVSAWVSFLYFFIYFSDHDISELR